MTHPPATAAEREIAAYAAELAAMRDDPYLCDADAARLPVLAAALGVAVRMERWEWGGAWPAVREAWVVGEVRE